MYILRLRLLVRRRQLKVLADNSNKKVLLQLHSGSIRTSILI